jgi:hypothetical protein
MTEYQQRKLGSFFARNEKGRAVIVEIYSGRNRGDEDELRTADEGRLVTRRAKGFYTTVKGGRLTSDDPKAP